MVWTKEERNFFKSLSRPDKIQSYLDSLIYNPEDASLSPRYVLLSGDGHCLEGALLAAAALEFHGHPPLVVDLQSLSFDDPHVIAVYQYKSRWGSIAKSNTSLLAGRSPVYGSIRELVLSYFDFYFDHSGKKSLMAYSNPINLNDYNNQNWRTSDEDLMDLGISFNNYPHKKILTSKEMISLSRASERVRDACFLGSI
jgi:hypothetical protein